MKRRVPSLKLVRARADEESFGGFAFVRQELTASAARPKFRQTPSLKRDVPSLRNQGKGRREQGSRTGQAPLASGFGVRA